MPRTYAEELGYPTGWFVIAESNEVKPGQVKACHLMGEEVVLFRSQSGRIHATSAYCPHLGAHLGSAGTVEGETLRCGFHGFCFNSTGECTKTGYGTRPPPTARLRIFPVREMQQVILVYYDRENRQPTWEIPDIDQDGWSPIHFHRFTFRGHPQETTENAADIGHFTEVHKYLSVRELRELHAEGPHLTARYAMRRPIAPGLVFGTEFDVHAYGLGYSRVDVDIRSHGFQTRQFIFSTLIEPDKLELRIGVSVRLTDALRKLGPLARVIPERAITDVILRILLGLFKQELRKDIPIWERKSYVDRPALANGDGPIGLYRRWARQFYPPATPLPAPVKPPSLSVQLDASPAA